MSSLSLSAFELFEGDIFFRSFLSANLKAYGSRTTAATKMELFDQVTFLGGY